MNDLVAELVISSLDVHSQNAYSIRILDIIIGDFVMGAVITRPHHFGMEIKVQTAWGEEVVDFLDFVNIETLRDPEHYGLKKVRELLGEVGIKWVDDLNKVAR